METFRLPIGPPVGQLRELVAFLARQLPQPFSFGAEHEHGAAGKIAGIERSRPLLRQTDAPVSRLPQFIERARYRLTTWICGTCSVAPEAALASTPVRPGALRSVRMTAAGPESGGGAHHRADVMRVGDLIEHDEAVRRIIASGKFAQRRFMQRRDLDQNSLMHAALRREPVQLRAVDIFRVGALEQVGARLVQRRAESLASGFR